MPNERCCVGGCNNDKRYPNDYVMRSHVSNLRFHYFPQDTEIRKKWDTNISRGLVNFTSSDYKTVCSNHFVDAKPTPDNPHPTLYLKAREMAGPSPRKRKLPAKRSSTELLTSTDIELPVSETVVEDAGKEAASSSVPSEVLSSLPVRSALVFAHFSQSGDVKFYTGLPNAETFRMVYEFLKPKARRMHYWKGLKNTKTDLTLPRDLRNEHLRALSLEQELLITMMRLKLGLLVHDLAFRFNVGDNLISCVFFTWIKLFSKELSWLLMWPDRHIIRRNLPTMFRKYYPKCVVIIDCAEVFIQTPSSLDIAAMCWSDYKHHSTMKYLVGITPNGAISFVSDCYGGRASDRFIVEDCGFFAKLRPGDQVMADRGFKIGDALAFYQCSLAIPPSKAKDLQMSSKDVQSTSRIANVRIYVEQAIKRMKVFHILQHEIPINILPLVDDIVVSICALTNFLPPLCAE